MMQPPRLLHVFFMPHGYRAAATGIRHVATLLLILTVSIAAQIRDLPVKAMFLEAAIRFISWPADSGTNAGGIGRRTFTIGIFCNDRFTTQLSETFARKCPRGVPVRFLTVTPSHGIDSCDLVYIPANRAASLEKILAAIRGKPVLTVTDFPDLTSRGVILAIAIEAQRIKCYINTSAAADARLGISHHLLQKSTIIVPGADHR